MHHESYHAPTLAQSSGLPNQFRYRGECTPQQAQSRVIQLESLGYNNIRCDQVNSGWFGEPTFLITADKNRG